MSWTKGKEPRTFRLFLEGSVADPAWIAPVTEINSDGTYRRWEGTEELERVVSDLKVDIIRHAAKQEAFTETLSEMGMSFEEYRARRKNYDELRKQNPADSLRNE